jgi:hypothetical protein
VLEKLRRLRKEHLRVYHDTTFYPYQELISDSILVALVKNLSLTHNATEEHIKKLTPVELADEISRQAGKTTAVVLTIDFVMTYFPKLFKLTKRLEIGIFAPQIEQAKTDFDRLKEALLRSAPLMKVVEQTQEAELYKQQNNSKTIVLPNGATCYIAPVSKTSLPESKSLALMLFEESQDLDDKIVKEQIWPMGANTNAPRIYLGTAGTRLCYFRTLGQGNTALKLYFNDIIKQRRVVYEETQDASHLIYEQYVKGEIAKHGLEADEIQRPYFGKWLIGTGQFTTEEAIDALVSERKPTFHSKNVGDCFAGIDTAKNPDSTVVTILRYNPELKKKELLNWCELRGENYQDQFDVIKDFLSHYNVVALAIDSTGQGDFMPDMFQNNTEWQDENSGLYRIKFSMLSKDMIYKNLKVTIQELLTSLPNLGTKQGEKFRQQMLDLQQKYNGQLLSVKHPDDPNAHDDYPDSWALAEWAFARWNEDNGLSIALIDTKAEKERKVKRNESGETTDYWPGLDFDEDEFDD